MVTPAGETTCKEMLSLADTKRTVPLVSVTSDRPAVVAWPSVTSRMLALSTGEMVYRGREGGTCRGREEVSPHVSQRANS